MSMTMIPRPMPGAVLTSGVGEPMVGAFRDPLAEKPALPIGAKELEEAVATLKKYQEGKSSLQQRLVEDELWWELRHWEAIGRSKKSKDTSPKPTSAWLFNAISQKHADAMDNSPEPLVLPRELSDEESAKTISSVLPVVMECNEFEQTYSDAWWEKLKHGSPCYGVFWDPAKENGLGDIEIKNIDLLKLFWQPGITDIQSSANLFLVELVDTKALEEEYPQHKGKLSGRSIEIPQYQFDEHIDLSGKSLVVDWYYKVPSPTGRKVLHYVKFVGDTLLYSSENEEYLEAQGNPDYEPQGWYSHGLYPVVLDVLFPEKGTPVGFGYVSLCKDPQLYIDQLFGNILEYADDATNPRHFVRMNAGINEEEYMDKSKKLIHVEGSLDDINHKQVVLQPLPSLYANIVQMKIEEMKDTASNRDVNSGSTSSGVTAAAAIAALQEAGNKASRDMIGSSYRAYVKICSMCIELMRQFYTESRAFRVTRPDGVGYDFVSMSNKGITDQITGYDAQGNATYRRPVFDIKVRAQKRNPFSRMELNERAKELYGLGFFNPENAQSSLMCLEMMDFEGIDKVKDMVRQGQTLMTLLQEQRRQMDQMALIIQTITGQDMGIPQAGQEAPNTGGQAGPAPSKPPGSADGLTGAVMQAHTPMTGYGQRLAKRSAPDMGMGAGV